MSEELPELTERQRELLALLPASTAAVADEMGVKPTTVEGYRDRIRKAGIDLAYDRDANQWFIADERSQELRRISTRTKQSKTREASTLVEDEQATLFRRLRRTEPLQADPIARDGHESLAIILGDTHFGDLVEKEYWDGDQGEYVTSHVYDAGITAESVATLGRKGLGIRDMMSSVVTFDDCYLFLLGDIATGEDIYERQHTDIHLPLNEQVEESVSALYQLITTLAREFETVQVRGVPGNHGTDKPSAAIGVNTDLLTYSWVDDRLRDSGYDNVDFRTTQTHEFFNTKVRDWRFHVRHGHDEHEHVDETAASARDWRGLVDEFDFHVAMKGHHHKPSFHKIMNKYPVFAAPSPKPGDEFASRIGTPDVSQTRDLGWCFGISDERPVTWQFLIDNR
jgi:predicted phosphodiesterase